MIILVSGAPYSGKDTVSKYISSKYKTFVHEKLSTPLKELTHMMFGVPYFPKVFEYSKDRVSPDFEGKSPRQAVIWVDQNVMKPAFGKEYLGKLLVKRMIPHVDYVVSDSGFQEEAWPIIEFAHPHNVIHLKIDRAGCTYENDSRDDWDIPGIATHTIKNDGDEAILESKVDAFMNQIRS